MIAFPKYPIVAMPKTALCSYIVATLALLAGPAHAVSINSVSTPSAVGWTSHGGSMENWQRKCDQALRRLNKAKPDTGAYAQFQLQRDKYCGVAAVPTSAAVTPQAPPMIDVIVSSPPLFASTPHATPEHAGFVSPTAVPEPVTLALLGLGLAGLGLTRRRIAD